MDLDLVIDQSQHGVLIFQRGRLTYANLRAAQMIGYQPGEIGKLTLGETLTIVHPADRARLMNALQTVLTGKFAPIQPEIRIIRNDGTYYLGGYPRQSHHLPQRASHPLQLDRYLPAPPG